MSGAVLTSIAAIVTKGISEGSGPFSVADLFKGLVLSLILEALAVEVIYLLLATQPQTWWLWTALILLFFTVIMANLAPVLILPIFYKFTPLPEGELTRRLLALAERAHTRVRGVFSMQMSRKTTAANAALMGLGNTRRIVLGDTMLDRYTPDEIEVVLAHELGHHVHHDLWKLIISQSILTLGGLYLVNLAAPDDEIYRKSVDTMRSTVDAACAIDADAVVFHVGSHLGAGFEAGLERAVPALVQVLERCSERTWLLMENSAGAGGTIGRSIDELAVLFDALGRHERLGICLDSCHLFVSGVDVTDASVYDALLREVEERIGLDRLRALHANDAKAPLGSNRDRHDNIGDGVMGEGLGVFLAHSKVQGLPVVLEVPGADGHGPNADEIQKLRDLHARAKT